MGGALMTITQMTEMVRGWFDQAGQANGPVLPDGWFGGRPYENTFVLVNVQALGESLVIQMSEDTTLTIDHPKLIYVEKSELIFDSFGQAVLRWKHYGGREYHERRYSSGQVRLVPPVGATVSLQTSG